MSATSVAPDGITVLWEKGLKYYLAADVNAKLAALEAERDALRADAERYRWLRDNAWRHTDYDTG